MSRYAADLAAIRAAAERLAGVAHRTPVATCTALDVRAGRRVFFKCEQLQKVGAFKFRGAWNAVSQLPEEVAARGVVTHSSGNHGQALALAASLRDIPAHVVVPSNATRAKQEAIAGYGARVIPCEPRLDAREEMAARVLAETGGTLIPPYDHPDVIAGQGTAALELLDEVPDLDAVVAPIGGGGLLSGTVLALREQSPRVRVFGAEPTGADDAARSHAAGRRIPPDPPDTIADGLLAGLGEHTWPPIRDGVEAVWTVPDADTVAAMRLCWERAKLLIEPSAAVAVAAVLSERFRALDGIARVGVILSGGNLDLDRLPWGSPEPA
ncbi:MAG: pyridoxal-phosphate dependent enzyme [Myxococcales bacterium]|nr:pyridoxal-phosphate dependent enzyme [Myxococcales bacterium]